MLGDFERWLHWAMESKGVRSLGRLSREAGLDQLRLGDWATGRKLPADDEYAQLSAYFQVPTWEIRQHAALPLAR